MTFRALLCVLILLPLGAVAEDETAPEWRERLDKQLKNQCGIAWSNAKLGEALAMIAKSNQLTIILQKELIERPVTLKLGNVTIKGMFEKVASEFELGFMIRDEAIFFFEKSKQQDYLADDPELVSRDAAPLLNRLKRLVSADFADTRIQDALKLRDSMITCDAKVNDLRVTFRAFEISHAAEFRWLARLAGMRIVTEGDGLKFVLKPESK